MASGVKQDNSTGPETTRRLAEQPPRPVRGLRAVVVEGLDAGRTATCDEERLTVGVAQGNDLCLTDRSVSRFQLEVRREGGRVLLVDPGSTNGTRVGPALLQDQAVFVRLPVTVRCGETTIELTDGAATFARDEYDEHLGLEIVGDSPAMRALRAQVAKIAPTASNVLLVGESGSGKERVAESIHARSGRTGPFVVFDCGAVSSHLVASELFGHERGAFTGAHRQHVGALERAAGGTLLLDEIGELPAELQPWLLGVLERRRFRRVGGERDVALDARVLAATHRDLRADVNDGAFRLDLFFRLAVVTLRVPPLRERTRDLPALVACFAEALGAEAPPFDEEELRALATRRWPGNLRELRNAVEARLALGPDAMPLGGVERGAPNDAGFPRFRDAKADAVRQFEEHYLRQLVAAAPSLRAAARLADTDRGYLRKLLERHGLTSE